jgi:hypothetical protein
MKYLGLLSPNIHQLYHGICKWWFATKCYQQAIDEDLSQIALNHPKITVQEEGIFCFEHIELFLIFSKYSSALSWDM